MELFIKYKWYIFGALCLLIIFLVYYIKFNKEEEIEYEYVEDVDISLESEYEIYVDIKGMVVNPGVIEISSESRVIDVITAAGGLLPDADISSVNLSRTVEDEDLIIIPSTTAECNDDDSLVSLNSASFDELTSIPGIGEVKAKDIIEYRKMDTFNSIEDIMNISGIGESLFDKIKNYITL